MTRKSIPPLVANFSKYLLSPQTIALGGSYLTTLSLLPTHPTNVPFPFPFPLPRPSFPHISISLLAMRLTPFLPFSPHPALFGTSPHPTVSSRLNPSTTHLLNLPLTLALSRCLTLPASAGTILPHRYTTPRSRRAGRLSQVKKWCFSLIPSSTRERTHCAYWQRVR